MLKVNRFVLLKQAIAIATKQKKSWNKSKAIFLDQQAEQRRRKYKHRNHINIESTEHGAILILNQFKNAETHVKMWNDVSRAAHKHKNRSGIY